MKAPATSTICVTPCIQLPIALSWFMWRSQSRTSHVLRHDFDHGSPNVECAAVLLLLLIASCACVGTAAIVIEARSSNAALKAPHTHLLQAPLSWMSLTLLRAKMA